MPPWGFSVVDAEVIKVQEYPQGYIEKGVGGTNTDALSHVCYWSPPQILIAHVSWMPRCQALL